APGKIETAGYAKVIEPLDPGRIAANHVEAGQAVKAGELLLELDPAEANADALAAQAALDASLAETARRGHAVDAARSAMPEEARRGEAVGAAAAAAARPDDRLASPPAIGPIERLAEEAAPRIEWPDNLPQAFRLREAAVLAADLQELSDALK